MRQQPPQKPPPVQRLRIRYAKRGRLRFTSHRDVSRAVERAVFRARIPMAYSSGFNPHPRISYGGAAPTGSASEAEYLEIALAEVVDPAWVHEQVDDALPEGLDVVEVVPSAGGALADRLEASVWRIALDAPAPGRPRGGPGGAARHRRGAGRADDQEGTASLRRPGGDPRRADRRTRGGATRVCDTRGGPAARFAVRETRRRSRRLAGSLRFRRQSCCPAATGPGSVGPRRGHGGRPVGS